MRKWVVKATILLSACICLSGCGNAIPELTDDQRAEVCEYAAQALVRHTRSYKEEILSQEAIEAEKTRLQKMAELKAQIAAELEANKNAKDEPDQKDNKGEGQIVDETPVYRDIAEFLGFSGVKIGFAGYEVCDSYPADSTAGDWQGLCVATKGNKLVVFKFDIENTLGEDAFVDIANKSVRCTVKINGTINKTALTTMLGNDFCLYRGTVAMGDTSQAVVVVEMSANDTSSIASAKMKIKAGSDWMETTLF